MKIKDLRANHLENPIGYAFSPLSLSWAAESSGKKAVSARVEIALDKDFQRLVSDSGEQPGLSPLSYTPDLALAPYTRYFWRVTVTADNGDSGTSGPAFFETGKLSEPWAAQWITSPYEDKERQFILKKSFDARGVVSARAYACGLGSYELWFNGQKASGEVLAPGFHDYESWLQYQTYDLTPLLKEGENAVGALLAPAWYMGRFGFDSAGGCHYGDQMKFIAEIHLTHQDGEKTVIATGGDWLCAPSFVTFSNIYDGEAQDARLIGGLAGQGAWEQTVCWEQAACCEGETAKLSERMSPPIVVTETLQPKEVLRTPAGETVIDFGQNLTGWVEFACAAPAGQVVHLQFGELLQDGNFYQENLRTAKAEFSYTSDGSARRVRPYGTFYGFRYAKVEGMDVNPGDFTACVIHSGLAFTGSIETADPRLNRLFLNALWGQRGNFLDVPTDCPQRDERMGWTGDAQVFAGTACFNMYAPAFYDKYMADLAFEQKKLGGGVPHVIPAIPKMRGSHSSCAWGDVACVLPWQLYQYYGDKGMLRRHYPAMKAWVDFLKRQDDENGGRRLRLTGFHFADWLALDNYKDPESSFGGTDCYYVASAYYAWSTALAGKAARALGEDADAEYFDQLLGEIKKAFTAEYFTPAGRCAVDTQTALVLALYMDLVPAEMRPRLADELKKKLEDNKLHLNTGFVGTPYLCPTLSENGLSDIAWTLLFNDDYPSWLYEVKMGATTIWERWNSVLPDGRISGTGMNSLNHYAYGSIVEWMYRYMCGLRPDAPGCRRMVIAPEPDERLGWAKAVYSSAAGQYESGWAYRDGKVQYQISVPFDCEAEVRLPGRKPMVLAAGMYTF